MRRPYRAPPAPPFYAHRSDPASAYALAYALGRPLALGYLPRELVRAVLTMEAVRRVPDHPHLDGVAARLNWAARDVAADLVRRRARAEQAIIKATAVLFDRGADTAAIESAALRVNATYGRALTEQEIEQLLRSELAWWKRRGSPVVTRAAPGATA